MFLTNKYSKCYFSIINKAKSRGIKEIDHFERHHIIPKSMGGNNSSTNLVRLTSREHFICHLLLPKMTTGLHRYKMVHAIWQMSICDPNGKRYRPNSNVYETIKKQRREILKSRRGQDHPNFGRKTGRNSETFTEEWKQNISNAKKSQNIGAGNPMYGKNHTIESRDKMSATRRAKIGTPGYNIRPPCSPEKAIKIKQANIGKRWVHKPFTKERKNIPPEEFTTYCSKGWIPGKGTF
jgi:hypothetical protein